MALRLRRDVQKASYYVWFLGAEEARGLRGSRVINPVLPYLIERSREQEPLKVTLQVSHKGIKILQGSSKHFIPHSAITSSVQKDDIVACVLLLYNPTTKCPLHVHAYRCDSETTAEALHQQLQVLINRPENQKRFAELETRLGISPVTGLQIEPQEKRTPRRFESSPKRFESSLGSDTGTSTRESECSEESPLQSQMSPIPKHKKNLFDSLAAELRAKLNGNGPPLLLPPRDYDTVHRSKGNLAAIELRRCQNSLIVGAPKIPTGVTGKQPLVSSRGSSGIGSDLAPSPERQDERTSSDDENWSNEADNAIPQIQTSQTRIDSKTRFRTDQDIRQREKYMQKSAPPQKSKHRSASRDNDPTRDAWREDEIRPIIMRPSDFDARFKKVMLERNFAGEEEPPLHHRRNKEEAPPAIQERKYRKHSDDKPPPINPKYSPERAKYNKMEKGFHNKMSQDRQRYDPQYDEDYDSDPDTFRRRENLTDKEKYHEAFIKHEHRDHQPLKRYSSSPNYRDDDDNEERNIPPTHKGVNRRYFDSPSHERNHSADRNRYNEQEYFPKYNNNSPRNPYIEPESLPYRESVEKMIKSRVMRYNSLDDEPYRGEYPEKEIIPRPRKQIVYPKGEKYSVPLTGGPIDQYENEKQFLSRRKANSSSPDSSLKVSPKDRFHDAKEKFRAMEKQKIPVKKDISPDSYHDGPPPGHGRGHIDPRDYDGDRYDNWSDEEQCVVKERRRPPRDYRYSDKSSRGSGQDGYHPPLTKSNSKSLSNLTKGYRHSYAEPRPALPRAGGRVGLAAVNPY